MVKKTATQAQRLVDGLIILGGHCEIDTDREMEITGKDVVVVQTKASPLGMYLL